MFQMFIVKGCVKINQAITGAKLLLECKMCAYFPTPLTRTAFEDSYFWPNSVGKFSKENFSSNYLPLSTLQPFLPFTSRSVTSNTHSDFF